jgi:ACS family pantothenate transporter-like MFS transporter
MILTRFEDTAVVFAAYYWAGAVYACQATFFAWCNDAMRYQDDRFRSVVIASMNMGSNAVNAWWILLFYSANMAPRFTKGMWAMIGCSIALALWTTGIILMTVRDKKKREGQELRLGDADVKQIEETTREV